ncbi:MAG TPA: ZIP family metal transporter [Polyangiaceae bacterium]|nr:ZIP family metal transporter [Polyangiaceae bacterium]
MAAAAGSERIMVWLLSLASVVFVSAVSLVGLLMLPFERARAERLARLLVSLAVGSLLGDAFIHLLPEAFEQRRRTALATSLLVLAGMLLFFVVEKLVRHQRLSREEQGERLARPELLMVNVLGDAVHNFIDGVLLGASYLISPALGVSTTLAVFCHELPQEIGDFAVLLHSGLSVRKAVAVNVASAGTAVLGTLTSLIVGEAVGRGLSDLLVPVTAGGFVYLAAADLIPELQKDGSLTGLVSQVVLMWLGIALMAALTLLE